MKLEDEDTAKLQTRNLGMPAASSTLFPLSEFIKPFEMSSEPIFKSN